MSRSRWLQGAIVALSLLMVQNCRQGTHMEKILVITGGHDFSPSFFQVFESLKHVQYDTISQPEFNTRLCSGVAEPYDALVFYDMWQDITAAQQAAFRALLEKGKGMVFLHHSLVSYQHWEDFAGIVGGKYIEKEFYTDPALPGSRYAEDITLEIKVVDRAHPVTRNVADFSILDEGYQDITINPDVHPLLSTSHPDCAATVAWTHRYGRARIVYLMLGHGPEAHGNANFRRLVSNAVRWAGGFAE